MSLFTLVAMATAACSAILGDFPDGRLSPTTDGSIVDTDADSDANDLLRSGPPGSICVAHHADIIDFGVGDSSVYWLQKTLNQPAAFSLIRCQNKQNTSLATMPVEPEALALSDQFVFWTVNRAVDGGLGGGVWRTSKNGGQPKGPWRNYDDAGPLAFVNDTLFVATHDGNIYAEAPDDSSPSLTLATGQGHPSGVTASTTDAYWVDGTSGIYKVSSRGGTPIALIAADSSNVISFLAMGSQGFFWATSGATRSVQFQCIAPVGCHPQLLTTPSVDVRGFAAFGEEIYWTTNAAPNGVVQSCTDTTCPQTPPTHYQQPGIDVSHVRIDASTIYLQAKSGDDTYVVQQPK